MPHVEGMEDDLVVHGKSKIFVVLTDGLDGLDATSTCCLMQELQPAFFGVDFEDEEPAS